MLERSEHMHIDQLNYFSEVYRTRSINAASLNLMISQQSLSKSIQNLEDEFNTKFFIRFSKGVIPTDEGEKFYKTAQIILKQLEIFKSNLNSIIIPDVCSIGYFNADITTSENLFSYLSQYYPSVFFDISNFSYYDFLNLPIEDWPNFIFTFMNKSLLLNYSLPENYELKILSTNVSFKIWLNKKSSFSNYKQLNNNNMQHINFVFQKSFYPDLKVIQAVYPTFKKENVYFAATKKIFWDLLMNRNYSATDILVNNNPICYPELINNPKFNLKNLTSSLYNNIFLVLIYHKDFQHFYPIIADYLSSLYNKI